MSAIEKAAKPASAAGLAWFDEHSGELDDEHEAGQSSPDDGEAREPWTLEQGLATARQVEVLVRPLGLFVSLTGGVLYRGHSAKDLDLVIAQLGGLLAGYPHTALDAALGSLGWVKVRTAEQVAEWRRKHDPAGSTRNRVEVWRTPENRRVDVFALRCER